MNYRLFFLSPIYVFLLSFILIGCGRDGTKTELKKGYFTDAGIANENGDFDKAIEYYKLCLNSYRDEDAAFLQYVSLQLARIYFSRGNYDEALSYAKKVNNSNLFLKAYFLKEEKYFEPTTKGLSTDEETDNINSFGYSLINNSKTIIGLCYLKKGNCNDAIKYFDDILPESEGYFYLALAYGLKGDFFNEKNYYKLNSEKGRIYLSETKEWLKNNTKTN